MNVTKRDGSSEPLDINQIHESCEEACVGYDVSLSNLEVEAGLQLFDGIKTSQIDDALIGSAASLNSLENQDYTFVAAHFVLKKIKKAAWGSMKYATLRQYVERAVAEKKLNPELLTFDLEHLNTLIKPSRDKQFTYIGIQTLADRYLLREGQAGAVMELPQHFYMRVAMGMALAEAPEDRNHWAGQFYDILSSHEFQSSTPTLFNSGTNHSQLASCFLNTVADVLSVDEDDPNRYASIYGTIEECARLSKYAGGIGTDWSRVRELGGYIKGTDGKSSGPVPYLKVYNDTAVAVNQGGKRQGSFAPYLQLHHPNFPDFCELKKESGDERQRAHDVYPASWIPDLFMQRVVERGTWSFFSVDQYPELNDLWGDAYKARYTELEAQGLFAKQMPAMDLWKKMLTMLFETGHPWMTWKDECNRRSPQQHAGVVRSSNLCTEITLNTSDDETAVCNLGSVNLSKVTTMRRLREVIRIAMRMLDNVITINFYPSFRARNSNMRHRPVGLGVMGLTEYLVQHGIDWESQAHLEAEDELFEHFGYYAIEASADLARERGSYESFDGSLWSKGILPIDTANELAKSMTTRSYVLDWDSLREKVKGGMRNSNTMAIAPTATISNIVGTTPCIEPVFERVTTKKNQSGVFVITDPCLRYADPSLCKEAFEIHPFWIVDSAAVRGKWLDQSQSVNIFARRDIKGKDLHDIYMRAWQRGLKTTYYLRPQSAKKAEQPVAAPEVVQAPAATEDFENMENKLCSIDNPNCEACQ